MAYKLEETEILEVLDMASTANYEGTLTKQQRELCIRLNSMLSDSKRVSWDWLTK